MHHGCLAELSAPKVSEQAVLNRRALERKSSTSRPQIPIFSAVLLTMQIAGP